MEKRVKHTYSAAIYEFARNILVVCPNCAGKALVRSNDPDLKVFEIREVRVVCPGCGFNKTLDGISHRDDPKQKRGKALIYGTPVDPFFHLPVWLQADFSGEVFWAYNLEHLDFLAAHVGAKLRERNQANAPRSVGSRLPRWMTSAANREAILKLIEKLKDK
jgi:DNA-directed RNA polymerase subunit RPC12/RpoP